jgi:hypothetical protein
LRWRLSVAEFGKATSLATITTLNAGLHTADQGFADGREAVQAARWR